MTDDKGGTRPYKPERYKAIIKEQIYISNNTSATYNDTESMTPFERKLWVNQIDKQNKEINETINSKNKK